MSFATTLPRGPGAGAATFDTGEGDYTTRFASPSTRAAPNFPVASAAAAMVKSRFRGGQRLPAMAAPGARAEDSSMPDREKIFIKMGLENKYLNDAQVKKGQEHAAQQRARGVDMTLGEALMELKIIGKTQYLTIQRAASYKIQRQSDKVLARILIESDYAPKQEVLDAMAWQKEHYTKDGVCRPVADLLIERGFLTVEQMKAAQKILALKGDDE
jgi:hypothetical protein